MNRTHNFEAIDTLAMLQEKMGRPAEKVSRQVRG